MPSAFAIPGEAETTRARPTVVDTAISVSITSSTVTPTVNAWRTAHR